MVTLPPPTKNSRVLDCPSIARFDAPGPWMVRLSSMRKRLLSLIRPGTAALKVIVDPGHAFAIASRKLPGPLSAFVVTVGLFTQGLLATVKLRFPVALTVYCRVVPLAVKAGAVATPFW